VLECPLYNFIRDDFIRDRFLPHGVLGIVKLFYKLDIQVDVSRYLTEVIKVVLKLTGCLVKARGASLS